MKIGIMQGRLTPSKGRGIQFFPFAEWEEEFYKGHDVGIREIEWIFDYENYEKNPIWTEAGCRKIADLVRDTGVTVHSLCFDYFMRRPFYKQKGIYEENIAVFARIIRGMTRIGAQLVEIPLVDDSALKNGKEREDALRMARDMADLAAGQGIVVGFETDMSPGTFREFLTDIGRQNVAANYDSGNSSGLGYDPVEEIDFLGAWIANVHVKDRVLGGGTVPLGTGSADFEKVFSSLKRADYRGSFILQAARGEDGSEKETIRKQIQFVKECIALHRLEDG